MTQDKMTEDKSGAPEAAPAQEPEVVQREKGRISWIWLVPLVALLAGASLLVRDWLQTGPEVTVSFESAEGLEVGQTKLRYRDVAVGAVSDIRVSPDRSRVLVKIQLDREGSEHITRPETRFWVVRPRLGVSGVSGLGTLLSGPYISVDIPRADDSASADAVYEFEGLEKPPEVVSTRAGSRFTLKASELGAFEVGSPVYYRRIEVGRVIGYALEDSGASVGIQVFIDAPHDRLVTRDARFWNASGLQASVGADGFNMEAVSLASIVAGAISFAPGGEDDTARAEPEAVFKLARSKEEALAKPDGEPIEIEMELRHSIRGLKIGAPVDFRGLELGHVTEIDMAFDYNTMRFYALVSADIYPARLGELFEQQLARMKGRMSEDTVAALFKPMVENGLRAQMRAGNLLTGQQYIALDFFPKAEKVTFNDAYRPLQIPVISGDFDRLQQQISSIVSKIDAIPFDGISQDLRSSLQSFGKLADSMDKTLTPQAAEMLKSARKSLDAVSGLLAPDSGITGSMDTVLKELNSAARSMRALADYLQTNPGALLRGRPRDAVLTD